MNAGITVKSVSVRYPEPRPAYAVKGMDFRVHPGEFACLLGPSGCGKSTTLNAISGFIRPTAGKILVDGHEVVAPSKDVQMIFQEPHLFPWKSAYGNIEFYLKNSNAARPERKRLVGKYLDLIGLKKFGDFYPHQLSVGMQQRVSLARALVSDPKILLMDEPFRAIDYQKRIELHEFLLGMMKKLGKTILFVTHDIDEAVFLADRVLVMSSCPGKIKNEIKIGFGEKRHYRITTEKKFSDYKKKVLRSLKN